MTPRRTSQLLVILAALFGVLAFVCACQSRPTAFPAGISLERWMRENTETEFPKLAEP